MHRIIHKLAGDEGFSLLEVIVATALSSLIMVLIYSAHRSVMSAVYDLSGIAEFYENVNVAINRIDKDFSCMYFNKFNDKLCFIGESKLGGFSDGKVNFVTTDYKEYAMNVGIKTEIHQSDIREVGYHLAEDKEARGVYLLMRREQNHYDDEPETGGSESLFMVNVIDIKFEFLRDTTWEDSWDSREYKKFPTAVRTTLMVKNYRGQDEKFVFVSYINLKK